MANVWYKQTFFEDEILGYEDFLGNYWLKDFGPFPYLKLEFSDEYTGKLVNSGGWGGSFNKRQTIMSISLYKIDNGGGLLVHIEDTRTPFTMKKDSGFKKKYKLDDLPSVMDAKVGFEK